MPIEKKGQTTVKSTLDSFSVPLSPSVKFFPGLKRLFFTYIGVTNTLASINQIS